MPITSLSEISDDLFDQTINWYKKQLEKIKSRDLTAILKTDIEDLEKTKQMASEYFKRSGKETGKRVGSENEWNKNDAKYRGMLNDLKEKRPGPDSETVIIESYNAIIAQVEALIDSNEKSGKALGNLLDNENKYGIEHRDDILNMIRLIVPLSIDKNTFDKIAESARAAAAAIPGISHIYHLVNSSYDIFKAWTTPIQLDSKDADQYLCWLEGRRDLIMDLKKYIRRVGIF
jgi:hypothetical protein